MILPALSEIPTMQAHPSENTKHKAVMLLNYLATNSKAKIRYYALDMIFHVDSNAAYLVVPNAKSRIAGYYYLSDLPSKKHNKLNGAVLVECRYLKLVVASAAEAETGGVFHNCQNIIYLQRLLHMLKHNQVATPVIKTDNSTAASFINERIKQKRSKKSGYEIPLDSESAESEENKCLLGYEGKNNYADYSKIHDIKE